MPSRNETALTPELESIILSRQGAILPQVVEIAWNRWSSSASGFDGTKLIVVTPGARAGRRFLELLVDRAERSTVPVIPPRMVTAGTLPEALLSSPLNVASPLQRVGAWARTLSGYSGALFGEAPKAPEYNLSTARYLEGIQRDLASVGLTIGAAAQDIERLILCPEPERWTELAALELRYFTVLQEQGLVDPDQARREALAAQRFKETTVLLVGTIDLPKWTQSLLASYPGKVIVCAIDERCGPFGRFPDTLSTDQGVPPEAIAPCESAWQESQFIADVIAQSNNVPEQVTLSLFSPAIQPLVHHALNNRHIPFRDANGSPFLESGVGSFLFALNEWLNSNTTSALLSLLKHPWIAQYFIKKGEAEPLGKVEVALEQFPHVTSSWKATAQRYPWLTHLTTLIKQAHDPGVEFSASLSTLITTLTPDTAHHGSLNQEMQELCLSACAELESIGLIETRGEFAKNLSLLVSSLSTSETEPRGVPRGVEILGWLELLLDDNPILILSGATSRALPERSSPDPFLPQSLRKSLGLMTDEMRSKRDAFLMQQLLARREQVIASFVLTGERGEPQSLSTLLFPSSAQKAATLYLSSRHPIDTKSNTRAPSQNTGAITLTRPHVAAPRSMPVTGFRDYIACPYRYYLKHILKLTPQREVGDELRSYILGTTIHNCLALLVQRELAGEVFGDTNKIVGFLSNQLDRALSDVTSANPLVAMQRDSSIARLKAFSRWHAEFRAEGWKPLLVETNFNSAHPLILKTAAGTIELRGRIDRIDYHPTRHELMVIDYKISDSEKVADKAHQMKGQWIDLQLPAYHFAAEHVVKPILTQAGPSISLAYLPLGSDGNATLNVVDWDQETLAQAHALMHDIAARVIRCEFWPPRFLGSNFDDFAFVDSIATTTLEDSNL